MGNENTLTIDQDIMNRAKLIAEKRGVTVEAYLAESLRSCVDLDFAAAKRKIDGEIAPTTATQSDLLAAMAKMPELTAEGVMRSTGGQDYENSRKLLAKDIRGFTLCCEWLKKRKGTSKINQDISSYRYSLMVIKRYREHVMHGSFIAAAIHCGFPYKTREGSTCATFGIAREPGWPEARKPWGSSRRAKK